MYRAAAAALVRSALFLASCLFLQGYVGMEREVRRKELVIIVKSNVLFQKKKHVSG